MHVTTQELTRNEESKQTQEIERKRERVLPIYKEKSFCTDISMLKNKQTGELFSFV